jgi:hypothetical protein
VPAVVGGGNDLQATVHATRERPGDQITGRQPDQLAPRRDHRRTEKIRDSRRERTRVIGQQDDRGVRDMPRPIPNPRDELGRIHPPTSDDDHIVGVQDLPAHHQPIAGTRRRRHDPVRHHVRGRNDRRGIGDRRCPDSIRARTRMGGRLTGR